MRASTLPGSEGLVEIEHDLQESLGPKWNSNPIDSTRPQTAAPAFLLIAGLEYLCEPTPTRHLHPAQSIQAKNKSLPRRRGNRAGHPLGNRSAADPRIRPPKGTSFKRRARETCQTRRRRQPARWREAGKVEGPNRRRRSISGRFGNPGRNRSFEKQTRGRSAVAAGEFDHLNTSAGIAAGFGGISSIGKNPPIQIFEPFR
jgi:hypothetical protein